MPVSKLQNGNWPHPARLPLGCGWTGHCTAEGHVNETPTQDILETFCNLGYATSCGWAPVQRPWDAVRFAVSAPTDAGLRVRSAISTIGATARLMRLQYVCECNHLPVEHGELEFDLGQEAWVSRHADARIQKMAECFLESYRSKKA